MELNDNRGLPLAGSPKTVSSAHAARRPYVLVVDDDHAHHRLMELIADFLQIHTTCVQCAEEALRLLHHTDAFELILLDCRMPEVDGFAFAQRYRALENSTRRKRVPILAVTALCEEETPGRCRQAGMDDCLFKPFELIDLKEKISLFLTADTASEITARQE